MSVSSSIEHKLDIFISSKINERFSLVRKTLKSRLLDSGLVASVYAFETEGASSQDVKSAYLTEVSLSHLCLFLIDNRDGVSDAVYAEHERAKNIGTHRLYFFCDESSKDATPLQNELMKSGEIKYDPNIHEFSDFTTKAFISVIQDIINLYRGYKIFPKDRNQEYNPIEEIEQDAKGADESLKESVLAPISLPTNTLTFPKYIYKSYSINSILTRFFNPYKHEEANDKVDVPTSYDELCVDFLATVMGCAAFDMDSYMRLKEIILLSYDNGVKNIINLRINAIADLFLDRIENCFQGIKNAYAQACNNPSVPLWLLNDIAIDMRTISDIIDERNNILRIESEAQGILDNSTEELYYPLLDRFVSNNSSDLLKNHFEMRTDSPYSYRMGVLGYAFENIASSFNIAVRFGSLTHILITRKRYADILFTKFVDSEDFVLFSRYVKMLLIMQDGSTLNKIVNIYNRSIHAFTFNDMEELINGILNVTSEHKRFISLCLLIEKFGYYLSDEQYDLQTSQFFYLTDRWCIDQNKIVRIGKYILDTIKSNVKRLSNDKISKVLLRFFDNNIRRYYDDVLKVICYLDYTSVSEENQNKIMDNCTALASTNDFNGSNELQESFIALKKGLTINTDLIDETVASNMPDFYRDEYDIETNQGNEMRHIDKYIDEIKERNGTAQASLFTGYAWNPCDILRNMIKYSHISLNDEYVTKILTEVMATIVNRAQQADQKISAILLALHLRGKLPQYTLWEDFIEKIHERTEDIYCAVSESFFGTSSLNTLRFSFLLLKIAFGVATFEESALGFATVMGYSERDFINAVRCTNMFLADIDAKTIDGSTLGVITNFILSIGTERHKDAQFYAINSLIEISDHEVYASVVLERLAHIMDDAVSDVKFSILRRIKDLDNKNQNIINFILQKGRTDNHFLVRKLAEEISNKRA